MNLLLDTHVLVWVAAESDRLSVTVRSLLADAGNKLVFSAASIWEVTVKHALGRPDFKIDPHRLRRGLIDNGYVDLPVTTTHALAVGMLPLIHRDPFDRLLIAQATVEGFTLLTADSMVLRYPGPIRRV